MLEHSHGKPFNINGYILNMATVNFHVIRCFDFPKYKRYKTPSPDLYIFNLLSVFVLVQKILNYYPDYPTNHLYFGKSKHLK